ncbi:MAG: bifunctional YncE family protein/alkaline phosphatase family protein [Sediminibacterium sp.]|nr:bifunctional YncE family protein/alkaline phosphatase family protein [Sediminibacterium sp.]TXT34608.1 MAG: 40-residue YVTN family beta-propeller repeat-containing protein [Chitinophagaceae bacterium]
MKQIITTLLLLSFLQPFAQSLSDVEKNKVVLPNGWALTPVGKSLPIGDLPLNMAVSTDKKLIAITNNGQGKQSIQLIDAVNDKVLDNISIGKSWVGLKFSSNNRFLYASGGNDNWILKYEIIQHKLKTVDTIKLGKPWPNRISPTGIDINEAAGIMYVVTKDDKCLYEVDLRTKKIIYTIPLYSEAYSCLQSINKSVLYISAWGSGKILLYNTKAHKIEDSIVVGSNPNDFCITKNGQFLFVANANDNSVSVVNLKTKKIIETLSTSLYANAPSGSTTNAVCLSENEQTLYIANADNNCISVFDVSAKGKSKSKGFIPVGWYPTSVKVIGKKFFVTNGKGYSSLANPFGPDPYNKRIKLGFQKGDSAQPMEVQYIGGLFKGTLSIIQEPSEKQLAVYSRAVYKNSPYTKLKETEAEGEVGNPIPLKLGAASPIKYVFYIVKENRTYDQVLGDVKEGNGDASLCLFGEKVTPNLHAIAKEFVLLDNFYCDGEVSADGHNWSMGAYATDYLEKTWVSSYGGKGGDYDAEGNRSIANNKNGFIWDHAKRAGISYRTYGEFADDYKPNIPVLKDHFCTYYTSWDESVRDTTRVGQWKRDFDSLLAINAVPQLNTLRIINDHTEGLRLGRPTPFAHVADNDLAIGMFIEYLSNSKIWKESAVFIVEDDAQDGPDHVDAHRTTAFVAGGFVKRGFVDHTMYSTTSMLKTIELILGMPPMSQFDAGATPMWRSFSKEAIHIPFKSRPAQIDLNEKNQTESVWQRKSELFDFSKEDRIQDREFTEVIWKAVKGIDAIVPAPKRAAFIKLNN